MGTHVAGAGFVSLMVGLTANYTPLGAGDIQADFDCFAQREYWVRV